MMELIDKLPEINEWFLATFTFLLLVLRASADLLAFAGQKLEDKYLSGWAKRAHQAALQVAKVLGWFGGGVPKKVVQEEIKKGRYRP